MAARRPAGSAGKSRPGARVPRQRPARRAAPATRTPESAAPVSRRTPVTTRAALLGVVVSALILLLALPLRTYLDQHGQIASTSAAQAAQRHRIAQLQQQAAKAYAPATIEQEARARLQLVNPGEKDYVVVPPAPKVTPPPPKDRPTVVLPSAGTQSWYGALWGSVQQAGGAAP